MRNKALIIWIIAVIVLVAFLFAVVIYVDDYKDGAASLQRVNDTDTIVCEAERSELPRKVTITCRVWLTTTEE